MVKPAQVSRKAYKKFSGERWNAYNDLLAMSEPDDLTPTQRVAHLAYWYYSEMINGGHFQYFINQDFLDHGEVIQALRAIDAAAEADILARAWLRFQELEAAGVEMPEAGEDFDDEDGIEGLESFDLEWAEANEAGGANDAILAKLEAYLDDHEAEFIEWVP